MTNAILRYCDACGAPCAERFEGAPVCDVHGPRWRQARHGTGSDVLVVRDGRVLLSRRAHEPERGRWELPGGFATFGETPAQAARREAREELGVDVHLVELFGVYMAGYGPDEAVQVTVFRAELAPSAEPAPDPAESLEWGWFAPDALPGAQEFAEGHWQRVEDWVATLGGAGRERSRFGLDR